MPAYGQYAGALDVADCSSISGSAWNGTDARINVEIHDGAALIARVAAEQFRPDLPPASLVDGQSHYVSARFSGTGVELNLSPRSYSGPLPVYQGWLDVADCSALAGWIWDANLPSTPVRVSMYDGANPSPIYVTLAGNFRQDLLNAGIGNGARGFQIATPPNLKDGNPHTISARFGGPGTDLWGSPKSLTCPATPPALETRRIGVRPTGSYWGDAGEQIDVQSGNLNYTVPLVQAKGRGGSNMTFALSYNSQNWRQDSAGTQKLGIDVGYGFGWKLQAGSVSAALSGTQVDHYVYTDASGAQYRLDQNTNGVWTSREGVYVSYDTTFNPARLYSPNGTWWEMGCLSQGAEQDAGTSYPTLMQDTNGNQIQVFYAAGSGVGAPNTSARIVQIVDARSPGSYAPRSYDFTYTNGHLARILAWVTNESYTFTYSANQTLNSPFARSVAFGPAIFLQTMTRVDWTAQPVEAAQQFEYVPGTGELTRTVLPLGLALRW